MRAIDGSPHGCVELVAAVEPLEGPPDVLHGRLGALGVAIRSAAPPSCAAICSAVPPSLNTCLSAGSIASSRRCDLVEVG